MQTDSLAQSESDVFLTARDMRRRYGNVSDMWLYRREHDADSNFPKPIRISGRRFWRLSDVMRWESRLGQEICHAEVS
jgi:predicted DNA-binding transcriptional regulator AlpA